MALKKMATTFSLAFFGGLLVWAFATTCTCVFHQNSIPLTKRVLKVLYFVAPLQALGSACLALRDFSSALKSRKQTETLLHGNDFSEVRKVDGCDSAADDR